MKAPLLALAALAAAAGLSFLSVAPSPAPAGASGAAKYEIDNTHSTVIFRTGHMSVSKSYGRFNSLSGTIAYDEANPKDSSITVSVKADSVDTNDKKRDEHLKSPDFLSAKEFPTLEFKSTKVEKKGAGLSVTGDLTLHGITKPVTVDVAHVAKGKVMDKDAVGFEGHFEIDPKAYEIHYMNDEKMLGPGIQVTVSLEAYLKP